LAQAVTSAARPVPFRGDYRQAMLSGLQRFRGRVLFVLSLRDLTAQEFLEHVSAHPDWQSILTSSRTERLDLPDMDHTFSSQSGRDAVAHATAAFLGRVIDSPEKMA
jgi:hypothetical protein